MSIPAMVARLLPVRARKKLGLGLLRATRWPPIGTVDLGDLDRTSPISTMWGFDRGTPVDRYYIEQFLKANAEDVQGRVLEVLNNKYTLKLGGDRVEHSDVLHHAPGNPLATVVADLTVPESLPEATYDCVICTQTLQLIYEVGTAVETLHRILKPGGTLLVSVPGISQISRADMDTSGDHWRFTSAGLGKLMRGVFGDGSVEIGVHGNVAAGVAFLHGIACEELEEGQLEVRDPDYEVLLTARAVRAASAG